MKIHKFIDNFDFSKKELEIIGENARQIIKVLRLKINEKIEISNGKGISALVEIIEIVENKVKVKIIKKEIEKISDKKVTLFCAILKKENFEFVVQKATECGVDKIIPIITERTIKTGLNLERLKKIAKEATEQSGRNFLPEISAPINFIESLEKNKNKKNTSNILFDISGTSLGSSSPKYKTINIFIGPEGGWIEKELQLARENNFEILSLGKNTLRAETASIIAVYLFINLK